MFARELPEAIELLEANGNRGAAWPTPKRADLRRLLLPKSHCHVYFEVDAYQDIVRILHLWDGRRARPPKL